MNDTCRSRTSRTMRIVKQDAQYRWSLKDDAGHELAHGFEDSKRWAWWAAWRADFELMSEEDKRTWLIARI